MFQSFDLDDLNYLNNGLRYQLMFRSTTKVKRVKIWITKTKLI
jgi:hypothetical protein